MIEQFDELAHRCGERDEGFFAGGTEPGIEVAQNGVVAHGAERGHVEGAADGSASTPNTPGAFARATVSIIRR